MMRRSVFCAWLLLQHLDALHMPRMKRKSSLMGFLSSRPKIPPPPSVERPGTFDLADAAELDWQLDSVENTDVALLQEVFKVVKDKKDLIDWVSVGVVDMYPYWNHLGEGPGDVVLKDPNKKPFIEVEGRRVTDLSPLATPRADGNAIIGKITNYKYWYW